MDGKDVSGVLASQALRRDVVQAVIGRQKGKSMARTNDELARVLDQAIADFVADPRTVGVSAGFTLAGIPVSKHAGTVRREERRIPTDDTLYEIGSVSKTMLGLLLAKAEVADVLRSGDDVRAHLVEPYPNLEYAGQPVRLWHLLDHVSGLPFMLPFRPELFADPDFETLPAAIVSLLDGYTRADFMRDLRAVALVTPPGEAFQYSNAAAVLLSIVLERRWGAPFEQLPQERIAQPLAMSATTTRVSGGTQPLATGHNARGEPALLTPASMAAAGGVWSTLPDMLRYMAYQADESDPALRLSHELHWGERQAGVAFNWQIDRTSDGVRRIWQSGGTFGFSSFCAAFPERALGIAVLANESDPGTQDRLEAIANAIYASVASSTSSP